MKKDRTEPDGLEMFLEYVSNIPNPTVLELGVGRSIKGRSTMHKQFVPHASVFHGTDIFESEDVDIIADVHRLSHFIKEESYDVVISCSTFEHLKYPHLAALEISKVLKPNGAVFIQTHHTFPLHAYPYDYFRFSQEALAGCFGTKNGITVQNTGYGFSGQIVAQEIGKHPCWLNSTLFGVKTGKTPKEYIYEMDTTLGL